MSSDNVRLVRQLYAWMAADEADKAFEVYDPEIVWECSEAPWLLELGFEPIYRGHEGVRKGMRGGSTHGNRSSSALSS